MATGIDLIIMFRCLNEGVYSEYLFHVFDELIHGGELWLCEWEIVYMLQLNEARFLGFIHQAFEADSCGCKFDF
jgi:hypothetical protein